MVSIVRKVRDGLRKARLERALVHRSFPKFVTQSNVAELDNSIPVFCFHAVDRSFEGLLRHLKRNGYSTLDGDQLVEALGSESGFRNYKKPVVLTFDDGWRSTWTIAYPLLKKYGFRGISFLVPTWMNSEPPTKTIDDLSVDDASLTYKQLGDLERKQPYLSWSEAKIMHDEGVFDFQSHSMTHDTVFTSGRLVDFVNPAFHRVPHKIPLMPGMSEDPWRRSEALGMPLYTVAPRLTGARRYLHDEQLRQSCLEMVQSLGAEQFFQQPDWRARLRAKLPSELGVDLPEGAGSPGHTSSDAFESEEQRDEAIRRELRDSKLAIEAHLGNTVRHLCFPFYAGSELASQLSAELGYVSNHWGWKPASDHRSPQFGREHLYSAIDETDYSTGDALQGRRTNSVGDDPQRIVRLPGDYIERLPGEGRRSLLSMFLQKSLRNLRKV